MITCNRCGRQVQAGSANCQYCGMPLATGNSGGAYPKVGNQEQELPAWLESLRASEPSEPPATGQPNFLPADLVDEGALPGWMRSDNNDIAENLSGPYPAMRRASASAPNTDSGMLPPQGLAAGSLIDERSLPSWLQENATTGPQPGQQRFAAGDLVQSDALPDWMRNMPPPAAQSVDTGRMEPRMPAHGLSASSLIDQQSLPTWLGGQAGQPDLSQQTQMPNDAPYGGQGGLAASSLLDMQALPTWLQEGNSGYQRQEAVGFNGGPTQSAQPGQPFTGNMPLSAGSLIDMNALPGWLREDEGPQQGGPPAMQQPLPPGYVQPTGRPGGNGVPRVENPRVPSRPRAEMSPQEQNEVAANVFSSMLGVASAPSFPGQPPYGSNARPGGPAPQPMNQPGTFPPTGQGQPMNQTGAYAPPGQQQVHGGTMPAPNGGVQGMQPGWTGPSQTSGYMGYQGGYPMGNQPGAYPPGPGNQAGMPAQAANSATGRPQEPMMVGQNGNAQRTGTNRLNQNSGKRSIFETIRSWFIR